MQTAAQSYYGNSKTVFLNWPPAGDLLGSNQYDPYYLRQNAAHENEPRLAKKPSCHGMAFNRINNSTFR